MAYDPFHIIDDVQREPLLKAIDDAFGFSVIDKIVPVGGGASGAYPFRVDIADRQYLVRLEGPASPLRNPHQYESMRIASAAGIAPRIHHINEQDRVAVMDFVKERPLSTFPGGAHGLAHAIGTIFARVQETPPFPRFVDYPEMVGRLWWWVCNTNLFAPGVLDQCTERLAQVTEAYVWDREQSVSSHNDPVPRNILFDGRRLWLIDWESAYRNDPLVDVAITLDSFAPTRDLERSLLQGWLGQRLPASSADRLGKVRALTRLYYAGVFLSASAEASGPLADRDLSAPSVAAFRQAMRNGEIRSGSPEAKHTLGKMYLNSFMTGDAPPGLDAAV